MQLTRRSRIGQQPVDRESGSALAMVLAIFAITILITTVVASSSINSLGYTGATRAGVQSLASAEAGVAVAAERMTKKICQTQYSNGSVTGAGDAAENLHFTTVVYAGPTETGPWTLGCPNDQNDHYMRLLSTGSPIVDGVISSRGDSRTVEAVYEWSAAYSTTLVRPSGPAIYSYQGGLFSGSSQLKNPDGLPTNINVRKGNAGCAFQTEGQSGIYDGNIVVSEGGWESGGSCQITGNVWANGPLVTKQSSIIFGSTWSKSLDMSFSSGIRNNAFVGGNANMIESSTLVGHLTAASKSGPGVPGSQTIEPSLNGQKPPFPSNLKPVPEWIDYNYNPDQWPTFAYKELRGPCNAATMQGAINETAALHPGPSVIDLRNCDSNQGEIIWAASILLPNDVALILPLQFAIRGGGPAVSTDGQKRNLWLIQPDGDFTDVGESGFPKPTCGRTTANTPGYLTLGDSYVVSSTVATMVYSPCLVTLGQSAVWRGQFYTGGVVVAQSASLAYVPNGLPGVDLGDGTYTPTSEGSQTYTSVLGERTLIRQVSPTN